MKTGLGFQRFTTAPASWSFTTRGLTARFFRFDYTVAVAMQEGRVCGFAAYADEELAWLYVDPDYMRRGIGSALVRHVIEHTYKRPLCIEVLKGNTPAIRLYESMGFHTTKLCSGKMPGNENFSVTVHCMQLE